MTQPPNSRAPITPAALPASSDPIDADFTGDDLLVGELTAAIFDTQRTDDDALPTALAERLVLTGEALVRARRVPPLASTIVASERAEGAPLRTIATWTGWLAAAALGVMVLRGGTTPAPNIGPASSTVASAIDQDVRLLRASLLEDQQTVQMSWTPTQDSTARVVKGEVLWSPTTQRGVMRIIGLEQNDIKRWTYQLWIFDETRDQKYPVDGGVFDIPPGQVDVLVPIRARLPVGKAVLFAVTVERPGGVVVSSRERIAMTATPAAGL